MADQSEPLEKAAPHIAAFLAAAQLFTAKPHKTEPAAPKVAATKQSAKSTPKPLPYGPHLPTTNSERVAQPFPVSAELTQGLPSEMHPIMHLESRNGQNQNHAVVNNNKWQTAHGHLGFMPFTAHERYMKNPSMRTMFPGLESADKFYKTFTTNVNFYNTLAYLHWDYLGKRLGNNLSRMAYGWRLGEGAAKKADDQTAQSHSYVKGYHAHAQNIQPQPTVTKQAPIKKSEPIDEFAVKFKQWIYKKRKKLKKSATYDNLMGDITDLDRKMARKMIGNEILDTPEFKSARFLAKESTPKANRLQDALAIYEHNHILAALYAYGLPTNDEFVAKIQSIMQLRVGELTKAAAEYQVKPLNIESREIAEYLQESFNTGQFESVHLKGKYNEGSMIVVNNRTHNKWLLKPDQPHNSPASGVDQEPIGQSRREVINSKVAELLGIGNFVVSSDLVDINGKEYAAMEFFNSDYSGLHTRMTNGEDIKNILEPYRASGLLFKWAFMDYILGNTDRHGMNVMADSYGNIKLIDHGSSLAGDEFDPANDPNSFIPYYLRAYSVHDNFRDLSPHDRYHRFPKGNYQLEHEFAQFVQSVSVEAIWQVLHNYGAKTEAVTHRVKELKSIPPEHVLSYLLEIWAGIVDP
jgi:hypothetical protein